MSVPLLELALFMAAVMLLALYVLAASGHFPAEHRGAALRSQHGALILWGTMGLSLLAGAGALSAAWATLPWYAAVIGGGAMLLAAPLVLQAFPDRIVDGRSGLLAFSAGAVLIAAALWVVPGAV